VTTSDPALIEAARLALRIAPQSCRRAPLTGEGCDWYHGLWPVLRVLGMGTSAAVHHAVMTPVLRRLAESGALPRVLISGCADHALLETIQTAYREAGAPLQCTVVDRCDTPLALCRWHAARAGCLVETVRADILDLERMAESDLICAHAFLGYFAPLDRPRLARRWRRLLRADGRLLVVQRLRPDHPDAPARFTPAQTRAFVERFESALHRSPHAFGVAGAALIEAAGRYAARMHSHPVRGLPELEQLLVAAGFTIEMAHLERPSDTGSASAPAPTLLGNAEYALLLAR
jgi:SAM-dependent methyltransferase